MHDRRSPFRAAGAALRAIWATRMGKVSAVLLLLGTWKHWILCIPVVYYGIKLIRIGMRRLLWSVRAKLVAFYLYSALLPLLLFVTVLLFVGYVVLGQVSARVVETRLERQVEWAEQRLQVLEATYWRTRARGIAPDVALSAAVDSTWGTTPVPGLEIWVVDGSGRVVLSHGDVRPEHTIVPAWLGEQRFAGLAAGEPGPLELRTRLRLVDGSTVLDVGSLLPVNLAVLNHGLEGSTDAVRAGLGPPARSLRESEAMPDSVLLEQGIVGWIADRQRVTVTPTQIRLDERSAARPDSADRGRGLRWDARRDPGDAATRGAADSIFQEVPGLAPDSLRLRSRYPILNWWYFGYPLQWASRDTQKSGPPIVISFSVEGATRALLRSGVGVDQAVLIGAGIVVGFLLLLQLGATLRGFQYARAISGAVGKLDRGVRAIRAGDFGHRVAPNERDQLGALALTFNDMSGRLRGLLDERATHEAVERELAIARDVQARLFPERTPYAPFLEAAGMCLPARTVSGDYYDFIDVLGGYDAVVADVSGKGISAALLMASLHSALRSLYLRQGKDVLPDPAEVLTRLNQHLHRYVEPHRFVTLFLARYRGDGKLSYCNAGHNPAALVRDGRVEWLTSGGLMLGPFPDLVYEAATVTVQPGDVLCLYTDGVTEAESPSGEHFGEERLSRVLRDGAAQTPRQILAAIEQQVRAWCGEREPGDDLTLVVLRITG